MLCLIRPPIVELFRPAVGSVPLPIGLAYIAAAVEDTGRQVHVIDAHFEGLAQKTRYIKGYLVGLPLERIVARIPPATSSIGISVIFTHEWPLIVKLVEMIKAARPDAKIILGGEHVTSMPEFCLATSSADILVLGEGEETIVQLLETLDDDRSLASPHYS
jgi:anaerobic magnesium-protoporphyrin IX monomethyl ester cyclase